MNQLLDAHSQALAWRIDHLVEMFPNYLDLYDRNPPDQGHIDTIDRLHGLNDDPVAAAEDASFVELLHGTLRRWRAFRGAPTPSVSTFTRGLLPVAQAVAPLAGESIADPELDVVATCAALSEQSGSLALALGKASAPLVLASKTLHHLCKS